MKISRMVAGDLAKEVSGTGDVAVEASIADEVAGFTGVTSIAIVL